MLGEVGLHGVIQARRTAHDLVKGSSLAGLINEIRTGVSVIGRQRLPLNRQNTVPLHISEGAVIGQHIKAVVGTFKSSTRTMTTIFAITDVRLQDGNFFGVTHPLYALHDLRLGQTRMRIANRTNQLVFTFWIKISQDNWWAVINRSLGEKPRDQLAR